MATFGATKWGADIEKKFENPGFMTIKYRVGRSGCCNPAVCQACICPGNAGRSYTWITDSALEANNAAWCLLDPFRCRLCTNVDAVEKMYYDREPIAPMCCGICPGGVANQNDLNYCCYCINCVCIYNICTKPCFGEMVVRTSCPREHCCYNIQTRCCPCGMFPLMLCIDDAEGATKALETAVANFRAGYKKGGAVVQTMAPVMMAPMMAPAVAMVPVTHQYA